MVISTPPAALYTYLCDLNASLTQLHQSHASKSDIPADLIDNVSKSLLRLDIDQPPNSALHDTYTKITTICTHIHTYTAQQTPLTKPQVKQCVQQLKQLTTYVNSTQPVLFQFSYVALIRYMILPTLIQCLTIHVPANSTALHSAVFDLLTFVHTHYSAYMINEFALLYETLIIPLLRHGDSTLQQLTVQHLRTTIYSSPSALQQWYYNADVLRCCQLDRLNTTEHLTVALCHLLHTGTALVTYRGLSVQAEPAHVNNAVDKLTNTATAMLDLAAAGLKTSNNNTLSNSAAQPTDGAARLIDTVLVTLQSLAKQLNERTVTDKPSSEIDVAVQQLIQLNAQHDKVVDKAIEMFNTSGYKDMLKDMIAVDAANKSSLTTEPQYSTMQAVAQFVYKYNKQLNQTEVGDMLSASDDKLYSSVDYSVLRYMYLKQFDYTGLSFVQALRLYLTQAGFRLPGEAQKIDRLLDQFCGRYIDCNPTVFHGNKSTAFIVSFAAVMLNTDLHDGRLKAGKQESNRIPMTCEQFISNLRGVSNDGVELDRQYLASIYADIKANEIQWKDKQTGGAAGADSAFDVGNAVFAYMSQHKQTMTQWYFGQYTNDDTLLDQFYDRVHQAVHTALHNTLNSSNDCDTLCQCIDVVQQFCMYSVQHNKKHVKPYTEMLYQLAQQCHVEDIDSGALMQLKTVNTSNVHVISSVCDALKYHVKQQQSSMQLAALQLDFGAELKLVEHHNTKLVQYDALDRINIDRSSRSLRTSPVHVFLCDDVILFAQPGINTTYKLSSSTVLYNVRCVDVQHTSVTLPKHCLTVYTPQRKYMLSCKTAATKTQWLQLLEQHINKSVSTRVKRAELLSNQVCPLCYRVCTLFRRKLQCHMCQQHVCAECRTQRVLQDKATSAASAMKSPSSDASTVKCCDTCYASNKGTVTDQTPAVTVAQHGRLARPCSKACDICDLK